MQTRKTPNTDTFHAVLETEILLTFIKERIVIAVKTYWSIILFFESEKTMQVFGENILISNGKSYLIPFGRVGKNRPNILFKVDHFCHKPDSQNKKKSMISYKVFMQIKLIDMQ